MQSISLPTIPNSIKHASLAWPLAISLIGTVGSLAFGGKLAHIIFGAAWAGLSLVHAFQHRKAMLRPVKKGVHKAADKLEIPHTGPDFFLRGVDVAFFMPGRIRLYCHTLKDNASYQVWIQKYLKAFTEIGRVEMNYLTGSILITYDVDKIQDNVDLLRAESYMRENALRHA